MIMRIYPPSAPLKPPSRAKVSKVSVRKVRGQSLYDIIIGGYPVLYIELKKGGGKFLILNLTM